MSDMGKVGSDLPLFLNRRSSSAKPRIRERSFQEGRARVEPLAFAPGPGFGGNAIKELLAHNASHCATTPTSTSTSTRSLVTRPLFASLPTVLIASSTISILATAQPRSAATVLSNNRLPQMAGENSGNEKSLQEGKAIEWRHFVKSSKRNGVIFIHGRMLSCTSLDEIEVVVV